VKAALERWLLRRWYGGVAPGAVLRLLAWVYGRLLRLRAWLYRRGLFRVHRLRVPVVVVGNLVAGGSGKTPLIIAIARSMAAQGWAPGVVSRGYGRQSRELVLVSAHTPPELSGDEPLLIARQTGLPVAVCADRVEAARLLVARGCNLILADDGLQHTRLGRDVEIEVFDGVLRHGNGRLLPAGPLREPAHRKVDFQVVNGSAAEPSQWPMTLELGLAKALDANDGAPRPLASFAGRQVHAVAGIGHPARFFAALRNAGLDLIEHPFPDHHAFSADELAFSPALPILMTEKDAVKCGALGLRGAWAVPAQARLPSGFFLQLQSRLADWSCAHVRG
jgi:tetraacyldisaccharide 4'-kinase